MLSARTGVVSPDGSVFVVDVQNNQIQKFYRVRRELGTAYGYLNKQDQKQDQNLKKKSPDFLNLGFFVPEIVVTRLGVEPRTY